MISRLPSLLLTSLSCFPFAFLTIVAEAEIKRHLHNQNPPNLTGLGTTTGAPLLFKLLVFYPILL